MGRPTISTLFAHLRRCPDIEALAVLPPLTVMVLLLNVPDIWYLRVPLIVISVLGLAWPQALRTTQYWFCMATLLGATVYFNWDSADNHQYLFVYWCLALCAAFSLPAAQQQEALAISSRRLLALCMLLATLWKVATPQYMDGTFFEYTLLADPRFADLSRAAGGMASMTLADNRELLALVTEGHARGLEVNEVTLGRVPRAEHLALALTWWTVLIEGALAVLFFLPHRPAIARFRNAALIFFAATTYSVAHVRGFGWMLMLLGLAQCTADEKRWRWAYLGAFVLIQLYFVPVVAIAEIILDGIGFDAGCGCLK
jgi:hypothetical protein